MKREGLFVLAILSALVVGSAGTWLLTRWEGAGVFKKQTAPAALRYQYVTLDRLIVLLNQPGSPRSHYLALDLAFQVATKEDRQITRGQLPWLSGIALKALSGRSVESVRSMTIDQLVEILNQAFLKAYGSEINKPFSDVIIRKLIIE